MCAFFPSVSAARGVSSVLALSVANQSMTDTGLLSQKLWRRTHVGHQPSIRANQHCHSSSSQVGCWAKYKKEVKEGSTLQTLRFAWQGRISYPSFPQQQHACMPLYDAGSSRTALEGKFGNVCLQLSWEQWMRVILRLQSGSSQNLLLCWTKRGEVAEGSLPKYVFCLF